MFMNTFESKSYLFAFKKRKENKFSKRYRPPGLNIVFKRRKMNNSLWQHKLDRQKTLYFNKNLLSNENKKERANVRWVYIDVYKKLQKIGSGVYASVYRAQAPSGKIVALKYLKLERENEGLPITAVREISLLKRLNHQNVIKLLDIVTSTSYLIYL